MRPRKSLLALAIVMILLVNGFGCQTPMATKSPTATSTPSNVPLSPTTSMPVVPPPNPVTPSDVQQSTTPSPTATQKPSVTLKPASFVLGDLTITPTAIMVGEKITCSIQVSNIGEIEGSYTVVFKYKSSGGAIGSENVEVTLKPGQTKSATLTKTQNESGTYFINVNDKNSQYIVTTPIYTVPATSASAVTSPPLSMVGINTHTELYGTGADPDIITLGPKVGGHPGWEPYQHKPGMGFEAYKGGSPVLAPFDMVLVGFRDTSTQIVSGGTSAHSDDVKLFFESASPDWPGVYLTVYHLLTSPLLTGHTQRASNDLMAPPAQGYQIFWDGNYTVSPTGNAASYGALIGYKVKRGELIGFAGTVPAPGSVGTHSFADFYFDVPDTSVNPNIQNGNNHLHLVQPGSFFYWKSYSPDATFPSGVLAYPFECDGYQLPAEQHDINFKYTALR